MTRRNSGYQFWTAITSLDMRTHVRNDLRECLPKVRILLSSEMHDPTQVLSCFTVPLQWCRLFH